ncbi:FG-GAP and VCBS repeat-containing protein [Streptomyces griseus]|uniref:FG-GAP and VCBS repeat-containing protein n=1 Tax=Streptomyces griseus TaxID=1911 RepID=UPI00055BDED8|nr:FG-GAP-like repeat-containing protein [Streptomyces griseus]
MSRTPRTIRRTGTSAAVTAALFLLLTGAAVLAAPASYAGVPGGTGAADRNNDFNGDGYADVLIGAPEGRVDGKAGAGYVTVQYGAPNGIGTNTSTPKGRTAVFSQSTPGVPGTSEAWDGFGHAVASGDIDGDGYDDAIIGAPGEAEGTVAGAGRVTVLYGSAQGLGTRAGSFTAPTPTSGARFGAAVAAARFSSATPNDDIAVLDEDGAQVFTLRQGRLTRTARLALPQHPEGHRIQPAGLTTGDYDKDGFADLVVSGFSQADTYAQGWSAVYAGGASFTHLRDLRGGTASASGDIDKDGYDDLVVGQVSSPDDEAEGLTGGLIGVYYGGEDGPVGEEGAAQWWTQNSAGVPGVGRHGDAWGADVSVADVNGDGYADVAVGAPGKDLGNEADAGAVWLLRGAAGGLTATGSQSFDQNTANIPGTAEAEDSWGAQVRLVDTDADGRAELVAAAPVENAGDGVAWFLPAGPSGLLASGSWSFGAGSLGAPVVGSRYGSAIDE